MYCIVIRRRRKILSIEHVEDARRGSAKLSNEIWIDQRCDRGNMIGVYKDRDVSVPKIDEDI